MTPEQIARLDDLESDLRSDHGDKVQRRGNRLTVAGSKIAATVENDGGAWLTWFDGTRTYTPPSP